MAAVRARRRGPRGPGLRAAARATLRRAEGGRPEARRDRRLRLAARRGRPEREAQDPLADDLHPGHGRPLPRLRPDDADHGRLRLPPVPRPLERAGRLEHPRSSTVGLADYGKLVGLLRTAFDGTAQPGSRLPIYYSEFGVQSTIPAARLGVHEPRGAGGLRRGLRAGPDGCLHARDRHGVLPADRDGRSSSSTSRTSPTSTAGSPGCSTRTTGRRRRCSRPRGRARQPAGGASPAAAPRRRQLGRATLHASRREAPLASARGGPVRRVRLLPGRPGLAAAPRGGARGRQGRVRRGRRGVGRPHGRAARLLGDRRAARHGLLPVEDHAPLRGPRRARRGAQRDAAGRLAGDAVLVPRDDEAVAVHERPPRPEDRPARDRRTSSSTRS